MDENVQQERPVVIPLNADQVFEYLSPDMQNYIVVAKKFSKQHKHFYIGLEHLFAAFLSESTSVIRRYINMPKLNWKKKVNDFLQKAYSPMIAKDHWVGYLVTPRMQSVWRASIESTRFKDVSEVRESNVLLAMLGNPESIVSKWIERENYGFCGGEDIRTYMANDLAFDMGSVISVGPHNSDEAIEAKNQKNESKKTVTANPFKILTQNLSISDLFKKKDRAPASTADSFEDSWEQPEVSADLMQTTPPEQDMTVEQPYYEEQPMPQALQEDPQSLSAETSEEVVTPSVSGTRTIKVGDQFIYVDQELMDRGIPESFLNQLVTLSEKYGAIPERLPLKGKKVNFEELLRAELTDDEYDVVLKDISTIIRVDTSRSPFRRGSGRLRPETGAKAVAAKKKEQEGKDTSVLQLSSEEMSSAIDDVASLSVDDESSEEEIVRVELSAETLGISDAEQSDAGDIEQTAETAAELEADADSVEEAKQEAVADDSKEKKSEPEPEERPKETAKISQADLPAALVQPSQKRSRVGKTLIAEFGGVAIKQVNPLQSVDVSEFNDFILLTGIKDRIDIAELLSSSEGNYLNCNSEVLQSGFLWSDISDCTFEHIVKATERTSHIRFDTVPVVLSKK